MKILSAETDMPAVLIIILLQFPDNPNCSETVLKIFVVKYLSINSEHYIFL